MHTMNNIEMWRHHHTELIQEAEQVHLARELRSAKSPRIGTSLLGGMRFWFSKESNLAENPQG